MHEYKRTSLGAVCGCTNYLIVDDVDDVEAKAALDGLLISLCCIDRWYRHRQRLLVTKLSPLATKLRSLHLSGCEWDDRGCCESWLLRLGCRLARTSENVTQQVHRLLLWLSLLRWLCASTKVNQIHNVLLRRSLCWNRLVCSFTLISIVRVTAVLL